jgi:hypothetical protein
MTTFDKREEGFEKQFAHDEELRFRANARRNKLLGLWAAEKLGLSGADADAYAKEVVMADFEEAGDHDVFRKIRKDFDAKGVAQSRPPSDAGAFMPGAVGRVLYSVTADRPDCGRCVPFGVFLHVLATRLLPRPPAARR